MEEDLGVFMGPLVLAQASEVGRRSLNGLLGTSLHRLDVILTAPALLSCEVLPYSLSLVPTGHFPHGVLHFSGSVSHLPMRPCPAHLSSLP